MSGLTEVHGEHWVDGVAYYNGQPLDRGRRYFADNTGEIVSVTSDVEDLKFGIATTGDIEEARTQARQISRTEILTQLAMILNSPGTITSRHRRLRQWDGNNTPPFFYWGQRREEFDGRTPWWITAGRRESYLYATFLEEHGDLESIVMLLRDRKVAVRVLKRFMNKSRLREEVVIRIERAIAVFTGDTNDNNIVIVDGDPVYDLASAVRNPDDWCRPTISLMLREAALEGLEGPLAALYPTVMTDRLLHQLWEQGYVPDALHDTLYKSGLTAAEIIARHANVDLRVDTGELTNVLKEADRLTSGAG